MANLRGARRTLTVARPHFVEVLNDVHVAEGNSASLECRIAGYPKPEVGWEKSGHPVGKSRFVHMERSGDRCVLQIKVCQKKDAGKYKCIAKNMLGTTQTSCNLHLIGSKHPEVNVEQNTPLISLSSHSKPEGNQKEKPKGNLKEKPIGNLKEKPKNILKEKPKSHFYQKESRTNGAQLVGTTNLNRGRISSCRVKSPCIKSPPEENAKLVSANKPDWNQRSRDFQSQTNAEFRSRSDFPAAHCFDQNDLSKMNGFACSSGSVQRNTELGRSTGEVVRDSSPVVEKSIFVYKQEITNDIPKSLDKGKSGVAVDTEFLTLKVATLLDEEIANESPSRGTNEADIVKKKMAAEEERNLKLSYISKRRRSDKKGHIPGEMYKGGQNLKEKREPHRKKINLSLFTGNSSTDLREEETAEVNHQTSHSNDSDPKVVHNLIIKTDADPKIESDTDEPLMHCEESSQAPSEEKRKDLKEECQPQFVEELRDLCVAAGNEAMFQVQIAGRQPIEVVWAHDDHVIANSSYFRCLSSEDGTRHQLVIKDVNVKDSGRYSCEAFSNFGQKVTDCRLTVKGTDDYKRGDIFGSATIIEEDRENGEAEETDKKFSLQDILNSVKKGDITLILGDFNAKVGTDSDIWEGVIGSFGIGSSNDLQKFNIVEESGKLQAPTSINGSKQSDGKWDKEDNATRITRGLFGRRTCKGNVKLETPVIEEECEHLAMKITALEVEEEDLPKIASSKESSAHIVKGPQSVTVLRGESVTLAVHFTGFPQPMVTWVRKGFTLTSDGRISILAGGDMSVLTINDVTADDSGKYTVFVENNGGGDSCFASMAVVGYPEPPGGEPTISDVTDHSLVLSWYGSIYDGGSVVTGYVVEICTLPEKQWVRVASCLNTSHTIQGLSLGLQYMFRVQAKNRYGLSHPSRESKPIYLEDFHDALEGDNEESDCLLSPVKVDSGSRFSELFDLKEEVGKGRFGTVYRCVHKESGHPRAAKIVRCLKVKDKDKVYQEIDVMNRLHHPKLMQLLAAYESGKNIILVMEYISGGELFERVIADDFVLTERDCVLFMRQICDGVTYMHRSSVLHLDLKPENILCKTRTCHQIKIIDFGLARVYNPEENLRVLFGTPEFVAPEIINYEPVGPASDMWSVGVICYVLLSGLSPFMGDNDPETFSNITRGEVDFDDEAFNTISDEAKDFISKLLIKKLKIRLSAENCLKHPWLVNCCWTTKDVPLSTEKLKKFIIRRNWQKTGTAIRALGRMVSLSRSSLGSSSGSPSPLGSPITLWPRASLSRSETAESGDSDVFQETNKRELQR